MVEDSAAANDLQRVRDGRGMLDESIVGFNKEKFDFETHKRNSFQEHFQVMRDKDEKIKELNGTDVNLRNFLVRAREETEHLNIFRKDKKERVDTQLTIRY